MPEEVRLWRINHDDTLTEIDRSHLDLEERLERWLEKDISLLSPGLLVIGRQVETDFGGRIDLLCIDDAGNLVVVELKRDKTPREITAQILDYGSWVTTLSIDQVRSIAQRHLGAVTFEGAFRGAFGAELPEALNADHRLLIVAARIDPSSERIIKYLSGTHGVNINAATFEYFKEPDGSEFLARVFLIEPAQVEQQVRNRGSSKRLPNRTYEELEAIAEENGVLELYRYAVSRLERYFQKQRTRSSISFSTNFNGSRKTVISLIPQESGEDQGLRFQIYRDRMTEFLGRPAGSDLEFLPPNREYWIYYPGAGADWEGFQGFFANTAEIDRLVDTIATARSASTQLAPREAILAE